MTIICQVVAYGRLEIKVIFKPSAIKVVAVAYERLSLARGFKHSDLTFSILENWSLKRSGRLREVVATEGSTVLCLRLYFRLCFRRL